MAVANKPTANALGATPETLHYDSRTGRKAIPGNRNEIIVVVAHGLPRFFSLQRQARL